MRRHLFPVIVSGSNFLNLYNYHDRDPFARLIWFKTLTRLLDISAFLYEESSDATIIPSSTSCQRPSTLNRYTQNSLQGLVTCGIRVLLVMMRQ